MMNVTLATKDNQQMKTRHPLATLREQLLDNKDPAAQLRIADNYLHSLGKMPEAFVLPKDHGALRPILEYFAGDLPGWVKYVKSVLDSIEHSDPRWSEVYALHRLVLTRLAQRVIRDRCDAALASALRQKLIHNTADATLKYAVRCKQTWTRARMDMLDELRRKTAKGRVSAEERAEALEAFWKSVDDDIANGDVPKP